VSYTALILDEGSHKKLVDSIDIPENWEVVAHHMTINMGSPDKGPVEGLVGQEAPLTVNTQAQDDLVLAVGVESPIPSNNEIKHITVAVNREAGGKPFFSNKLTDWQSISPITLKGVVTHVEL
jgi:hypothetical protein